MKISEIITDKYKLRIPPNVYYDLLADVREAEEEQEPICPSAGIDCEDCPAYEDAISREAVLKIIDGWYEQNRDTDNIEDLIVLITYMDSVNPQKPVCPSAGIDCEDCPAYEKKSEWQHDHEILKAYSDGANDVLDKIRAEIEQKCCITVGRENDPAITLHDVFEIIDKYKAEGGDKE